MASKADSQATAISLQPMPSSSVHERHVSVPTDDHNAELQRTPTYNSVNDPFALSGKIKPIGEIHEANISRKLINPSASSKNRKVKDFYEAQNENIERLLKPVDEHVREAKEQQGDDQLKFKIAVYGSLAANIILAALQLYAAATSGSLSL